MRAEKLHGGVRGQVNQRRPGLGKTLAMTAHAAWRSFRIRCFTLHKLIVCVDMIAGEARGAMLVGCAALQRVPEVQITIADKEFVFRMKDLIGKRKHARDIRRHTEMSV